MIVVRSLFRVFFVCLAGALLSLVVCACAWYDPLSTLDWAGMDASIKDGSAAADDGGPKGDDGGMPAVTVKSLSAGGGHTCALLSNGRVECWGDNSNGQLGNGTTIDSATPVEVSGLTGVVAVAAGWTHTCAIIQANGVKCWGARYGSTDQTTPFTTTPVDIAGLDDAVAIAAAHYHTCVLTSAGGVKCWGDNAAGQLGDGTEVDSETPVAASGLATAASLSSGYLSTCAVTKTGQLLCWGYSLPNAPTDLSALVTGVGAASIGAGFTCALMTNQGVKCWGGNTYGQLGDGTVETRTGVVDVIGLTNGVKAIATGLAHTCALTKSGAVQCWGTNWNCQLGTTDVENSPTPLEVPGIAGVVQVADGNSHTCVLLSSGGAKCWGDNRHGQIGNGKTAFCELPVDVLF